jgi:hypothetical protein
MYDELICERNAMNDLPPRTDPIPIMIVKKELNQEDIEYKALVVVSHALWEEMSDHATRLGITLNKFVNQALKQHVRDLYYEQEETEKYTAFSEMQLSPSAIHPKPNWSYMVNEKKEG